jgi:hypothetical protein
VTESLWSTSATARVSLLSQVGEPRTVKLLDRRGLVPATMLGYCYRQPYGCLRVAAWTRPWTGCMSNPSAAGAVSATSCVIRAAVAATERDRRHDELPLSSNSPAWQGMRFLIALICAWS